MLWATEMRHSAPAASRTDSESSSAGARALRVGVKRVIQGGLMRINTSAARLLLGAGTTAVVLLANITGGAQGQAPAPAAGQAPGARGGGGGRGAGGGGVAPALFTAVDAN